VKFGPFLVSSIRRITQSLHAAFKLAIYAKGKAKVTVESGDTDGRKALSFLVCLTTRQRSATGNTA